MQGVFPALQGLEYGLVATELKRLEDSVRAGRSQPLTVGLQLGQAAKTCDYASKALQAGGLASVSWMGKTVCCITPLVIALLKGSSWMPEGGKRVLQFVQDHLTNLCQVANVASCVALIILGHPFFAVPSLLVLGIGFCDRQGWLPLSARHMLHRYMQPALILSGILAGSVLDRIFTVFSLVLWGIQAYQVSQKKQAPTFQFQQNLTVEKAERFLRGELAVKVNPLHLSHKLIPRVPDIDLQALIRSYDQIENWPKHIGVLRKKMRNDPRFVADYGTPDGKTDEEIIALARHALVEFERTIRERRVLQGEPADYQTMENYLKVIAHFIQTTDREIDRVDALFRLAIEGGEYCGPGKFEVIESVYAQVIGRDPETLFLDKLSLCLQDERHRWIQDFYYTSYVRNPIGSVLGRLIDWQDIHSYNLFINLYGDEFGLRKVGAENDDTAIVDPLFQWVISKTLQNSIRDRFWRSQGRDTHEQAVGEALGTLRLPKDAFYNFWGEWIDRQPISALQKAHCRRQLSQSRLFGVPMEEEERVNAAFIALLFLDAGIYIEERPQIAAASFPVRRESLVVAGVS